MNQPAPHTFTKLEVKQAKHELATYIKRYFGEIWRIPSDGEYVGKSWDCTSMLILDAGLWRLMQAGIHAGAKRAAGTVVPVNSDTALRITILYNPKDRMREKGPGIKIFTPGDLRNGDKR